MRPGEKKILFCGRIFGKPKVRGWLFKGRPCSAHGLLSQASLVSTEQAGAAQISAGRHLCTSWRKFGGEGLEVELGSL